MCSRRLRPLLSACSPSLGSEPAGLNGSIGGSFNGGAPPSDLWHRVCSCVDGANCAFRAQVMKEVCANGNVDLDRVGSGSPVHKPELEKVNAPDTPQHEIQMTMSGWNKHQFQFK